MCCPDPSVSGGFVTGVIRTRRIYAETSFQFLIVTLWSRFYIINSTLASCISFTNISHITCFQYLIMYSYYITIYSILKTNMHWNDISAWANVVISIIYLFFLLALSLIHNFSSILLIAIAWSVQPFLLYAVKLWYNLTFSSFLAWSFPSLCTVFNRLISCSLAGPVFARPNNM